MTDALKRAAQIFERSPISMERAGRHFETLAKYYSSFPDWSLALLYYKKAWETFKKANDGRTPFVHVEIAKALCNLVRYKEAGEIFEQVADNHLARNESQFIVSPSVFAALMCRVFTNDWAGLQSKMDLFSSKYPFFVELDEYVFVSHLLEHHDDLDNQEVLKAINRFQKNFFGDSWIQEGLKKLALKLESSEVSYL